MNTLTESEKIKAFNDIEDVLEALFDGSMPVIVMGIKDKQTPFIVSNIGDTDCRLELLRHFVAKEEKMKQEKVN